MCYPMVLPKIASLGHKVTFEVQSVSGDVKLDLSAAMWVPGPRESSLNLCAINLIIENIYS
jgi:hypothetical protein